MSSAELAVTSNVSTAGFLWLANQTRDPNKAMARWEAGRTTAVPVGTALVVVRVLDDRLGRTAFQALREQMPDLLGPVIANRSIEAVEFLSTARPPVWMGSATVLLDGSRISNRDVQCPPPDRLASGRRWLNPPRAVPGADLVLTNPLHLVRALGFARDRLIQAGHRFTT
ncbi:hypothetical protein [Kitasatospora cineracea]|uniref:hypothetical protein n=1 Tax=Kitasatospora cineracea TaxID=88074 RepID=UPI0033E6443C